MAEPEFFSGIIIKGPRDYLGSIDGKLFDIAHQNAVTLIVQEYRRPREWSDWGYPGLACRYTFGSEERSASFIASAKDLLGRETLPGVRKRFFSPRSSGAMPIPE